MGGWLEFLIPLVCLQYVLGGILRICRPARYVGRALRRDGPEGAEAEARAGEEPAEGSGLEAAGPAGHPEKADDERRLRRIRRSGAIRLAAGSLGIWGSGFGLVWTGAAVPEWTDGGAPRLAELARRHCLPYMRQGGADLAVGVISGQDRLLMGFGRRRSGGQPPDAGTLFEIGSITKVFTGIALAVEVERGAVRLDQPVRTLLPPGLPLAPALEEVRVEHLTTHTSGLPRLPRNCFTPLAMLRTLFGGNPYAGYPEAKFLEALRDVRLETPPGKKHEYSNWGTGLLGYTLARRAGKSYESLVRDSVLAPLGMDDTAIALSPEQRPRFGPGWRSALRLGPLSLRLEAQPWELGDHLAGAGALRSTPADMLKFLEANLRPDGSPLGPALRRSHRELFRESDRQSLGMGWFRLRIGQGDRVLLAHNGGTGGFSSFLGFTGDGSAGVFVLSSAARLVDPIASALLRDAAAAAR